MHIWTRLVAYMKCEVVHSCEAHARRGTARLARAVAVADDAAVEVVTVAVRV